MTTGDILTLALNKGLVLDNIYEKEGAHRNSSYSGAIPIEKMLDLTASRAQSIFNKKTPNIIEEVEIPLIYVYKKEDGRQLTGTTIIIFYSKEKNCFVSFSEARKLIETGDLVKSVLYATLQNIRNDIQDDADAIDFDLADD